MKTAAKVITWALIVLLLVGAIVGILFMTDGGNEDFKNFTLSHDGKLIVNSESSMAFDAGSRQRFDVKYIFDLPNSDPREYNVKVVPNPDADFEFTVDGEMHVWREEKDITSAFEIEKGNESFVLSLREHESAETILQALYSKQSVKIGKQLGKSERFYTLVVSSYNEKVTYRIHFSITRESEETDGNPQKAYSISYHVTALHDNGFDDWNYMVEFDCTSEALAGDTVTFKYSTLASIYRISLYGEEDELIEHLTGLSPASSGTLSFVMPSENVCIEFSGLY